jgi:hypothetical protein
VFAYGFLESDFQQYETSVVDGMHHELSKEDICRRLVCLVCELFDRHGDCTGGSRVLDGREHFTCALGSRSRGELSEFSIVQRFLFSIALFLTLHAIGVRYTYAEVPFGSWLQRALSLDRNHFDRIVHFCFGFLLTYPLEDWFRLFAHVRGWLRYYLPIITILGLSGLWEIVESWFAQLMNPDLGLVFLGSQGDQWDAQKDMSAALYGSSALC